MNILEGIVFAAGIGGVIFFSFGVLGVVSDFIFSRLKWLNDLVDTLPMMQADENSY